MTANAPLQYCPDTTDLQNRFTALMNDLERYRNNFCPDTTEAEAAQTALDALADVHAQFVEDLDADDVDLNDC